MAKPRIFVSSTYYDLKHIRSSLEIFIEGLGYESILSEKGDIAYAPDIALDQSCYREVRNSDIFVLIIGGRYGAEKSEGREKVPREFFDRYDSITKQEYSSAVEKDIPVYILIEKAVYADFETYLRNKTNKKINYAHVDSVNIFKLIEQILAQPRNNPVYYFDKYAEIETWLRDQWSGLFRELLTRMTSQQQLSSLSTQVRELSEINRTLKNYLEQVVSKIAPDESTSIINSEADRLNNAMLVLLMENNGLIRYLLSENIPMEDMRDALVVSPSIGAFSKALQKKHPNNKALNSILTKFEEEAARDFSELIHVINNPDSALPLIRNLQTKRNNNKHKKPEEKARAGK